MSEFLQYQDQTSQYYSDLMNKLERMNSTLGFMLHYIDDMQSRIEERLHMIQGYLGWAGETRRPQCHKIHLPLSETCPHVTSLSWFLPPQV